MKRVAVIGAAGYLGLELAAQLRGVAYEVNAVTRENGRFLLRDSGFKIVAPEKIASLGKVDVIVNLAYPNSGPLQYYPAKNREILGQIQAIADRDTRIIHVSTQAVFGYGFERPIVVRPVEMVRDYAYAEAKIELENLLISQIPSNSTQIVRLGNIWGPGSPTWTVALVNKILFGEPVGVEGVDGYCNATDVANTASYLSFLINMDELRGLHFYHLAEMSGYRWSAWTDRIEAALGQKSVRLSNLQRDPQGLKEEVREALSPLRPGALYRNLAGSRISGSNLRTLIRGMGEQRFDKVKKRFVKTLPSGYSPTAAERGFLNVVSAQTQFETHVLDQWSPPVDFEESWSRIEAWMSTAGYTIRGRQNC
jgi:nucleoside-diphosphate-sugar epimerase